MENVNRRRAAKKSKKKTRALNCSWLDTVAYISVDREYKFTSISGRFSFPLCLRARADSLAFFRVVVGQNPHRRLCVWGEGTGREERMGVGGFSDGEI